MRLLPKQAESIEALAQRQLEAYNARDLPAFLSCYSESVQVFRPPATVPALDGKAAFAAFYESQRFNLPALRAELLNRMVVGARFIDHERIHGIGEAPVEMAFVAGVENGVIQTVHVFAATP